MNISSSILKFFGWKLKVSVPDYDKCVYCVAPHTSNWDFILGELAIHSINRKAGFLMKEAWFFFPLGNIFRSMGGIPVPRKKGADLVAAIVEKYNNASKMALAVTPEGTRKLTKHWRKGFIYIALDAKIPLILAYIDFKTKTIGIEDVYHPTGDIEKDMRYIKDYYSKFTGKYPEKFSTEDDEIA